jgi:hypothetical protein
MKQSPQEQKIEKLLRSSKLSAGGFMGNDSRNLGEVIEADAAELARLNITSGELAERMQIITNQAKQRLGNWVAINERLQARADEAKGVIVCPWPHPGRFDKRVTYLKDTEADRQIKWSDLNIHLIAEHGFFEGKGAAFRLEPAEVVEMVL